MNGKGFSVGSEYFRKDSKPRPSRKEFRDRYSNQLNYQTFSLNKKSPFPNKRKRTYSWRSGRDSNPRPPA